MIAVLVGVAAAYLGGLWDGALSLLTDVLLVIPLFPLLIVIAGYAHGGGTLVLILVITVTSWSYTARQLRVAGAVAAPPGLPGGGAGARRAAGSTSSWWRSSPR